MSDKPGIILKASNHIWMFFSALMVKIAENKVLLSKAIVFLLALIISVIWGLSNSGLI